MTDRGLTHSVPASVQTHAHVWLPAPAGVGDASTLVLLHGTGGNEQSLLPLGRKLVAAAGVGQANVLSPRGNVLEHGMARFFRRLSEGVFDVRDVIERSHALAAWLEACAQHYKFKAQRTVVVGFSNGANVAATMALACPAMAAGLLAKLILLRPMVVLTPADMSLPEAGALAGAEVVISAGLRDVITPARGPRGAHALAQQLTTLGAQVQYLEDQGDHSLTQAGFDAAVAMVRTV